MGARSARPRVAILRGNPNVIATVRRIMPSHLLSVFNYCANVISERQLLRELGLQQHSLSRRGSVCRTATRSQMTSTNEVGYVCPRTCHQMPPNDDDDCHEGRIANCSLLRAPRILIPSNWRRPRQISLSSPWAIRTRDPRLNVQYALGFQESASQTG